MRPLGPVVSARTPWAVGFLFFISAIPSCARPNPWDACRAVGAVGFAPTVARCDTPGCQSCAVTLDRAYRTAPDALRVHFMQASAAAREAFLGFAHPVGPYAIEHCTAGLAPHAPCAAYTSLCRDVIATGLRSDDTSLGLRGQLTLAAGAACPAARAQIVSVLTQCESLPPGPTCADPACLACEAGHLAALTVVADEAVDAAHATALHTLIDNTPEPVARAIVENLGAPDAPVDIDTVPLQRGLRGWCFALVRHSSQPPPFACYATMTRFLAHTEYPDSDLAWASLAAAHPDVRTQVVQVLRSDLARHGGVPAAVTSRLAALPPAVPSSIPIAPSPQPESTRPGVDHAPALPGHSRFVEPA